MTLRDYLDVSPVIPVLTIHRAEDGPPLARALVAGGLRVLEVTLRTAAALEALRRISHEVPEAIAAAGTVLCAQDLERAAAAGARFAFSPGLTEFMLEEGPVPILPGVATASEVMKARDKGVTALKFFPAVPAGGVGALQALAGPFPEMVFCPTGGIDQVNAASFLRLSNVLCVGGSWVAPEKKIADRDWASITALARAAADLAPPGGSNL